MTVPAPRHVSPDEWAALRDAIPSFTAEWEAFLASEMYVPGEAYNYVCELVEHIARRLDAGDQTSLWALIDAFEAVYATSDDDLEAVLRIGVLEDLIHAAEERGIDLVRMWLRLGPAGRLGFAEAYRYTHSGRVWEPPAAVLHPRKRSAGKKKGRTG
jgi:hypothetical protein